MNQVSVILLSYNNLSYLYQAIDSVLIQDYPDIQLIVSDDGSKEFEEAFVEEYIKANKSDNIVEYCVIGSEINEGTVKNLNKALKKATGEFIVPMAADDVLYDSKVISNFVRCFIETDASSEVVTSQVERYDVSLCHYIGSVLTEDEIRLLQSEDNSELYGRLSLHCFIPSGGTAYRRSIFDKYGLFDERYRLVEDWPMFLKLARNKTRFLYGNLTSVKHRDKGVSSNACKTKKQYQTDLIRIMEEEIFPNAKYAPAAMEQAIKSQCRDKRVIYDLRFHFKDWSLREKVYYLFRINTITAILKGVKRRIARDE